MRPSSFAIVVAAGVTGAALIRSSRVKGTLRREAELLGLRAYLAAVDRGVPHGSFISELRHTDCQADGGWLARAFGPSDNGVDSASESGAAERRRSA